MTIKQAATRNKRIVFVEDSQFGGNIIGLVTYYNPEIESIAQYVETRQRQTGTPFALTGNRWKGLERMLKSKGSPNLVDRLERTFASNRGYVENEYIRGALASADPEELDQMVKENLLIKLERE